LEHAETVSAKHSATKTLKKQRIKSAVDHVSKDQQTDAENCRTRDPSHEAAKRFFLNFGIHFAVLVVAHNCLLIRVCR
jgi:hypothetical protein